MMNVKDIFDSIATDAAESNYTTHTCHDCGCAFNPMTDGCPLCGINANVSRNVPYVLARKKKIRERRKT